MAHDPSKPVKRLKYFTGQFLEAADFTAEQDYHLDMRLRGNRALYYSAGILDDGFNVTPAENDTKIEISPGIGVNTHGQEIVIVTPIRASLPVVGSERAYFVTLKYKDRPTDEQTPDQDISDTTRIEEIPIVELIAEGIAIDKDSIAIARVTVDAVGRVDDIDRNARQYANARFLGKLGVGEGTTAEPSGRLTIKGTVAGQGSLSFLTNSEDFSYDGGVDRLFVFRQTAPVGSGNGKTAFLGSDIGIGTTEPHARLHVIGDTLIAGNTTITESTNPLRFTGEWSGFPDNATDRAEISNDTNIYKTLMIVGNKSAELGRRVSVWDRLEVNGTLHVSSDATVGAGGNAALRVRHINGKRAGTVGDPDPDGADSLYLNAYNSQHVYIGAGGTSNLHVSGKVGIGTDAPQAKLQVLGGAIMPAVGNNENAGIMFPEDPGGGGGDKAWIRYYARSGERTALEIGVANDALNDPFHQDDILLMPSGGVGIGTTDPQAKLHVNGDLKVNGPFQLNGGTVFNKFQSGTQRIGDNTVSNTSKVVIIDFPTGFSSIPRVIVTVRNQDGVLDDAGGLRSGVFAATIREVTVLRFSANIWRVDNYPGNHWEQSLQLDWFAWTQA